MTKTVGAPPLGVRSPPHGRRYPHPSTAPHLSVRRHREDGRDGQAKRSKGNQTVARRVRGRVVPPASRRRPHVLGVEVPPIATLSSPTPSRQHRHPTPPAIYEARRNAATAAAQRPLRGAETSSNMDVNGCHRPRTIDFGSLLADMPFVATLSKIVRCVGYRRRFPVRSRRWWLCFIGVVAFRAPAVVRRDNWGTPPPWKARPRHDISSAFVVRTEHAAELG